MTYTITKCKASRPSTCIYHNAIKDAEKAKANGDYDAYYEARRTIETAEATGWVENEFSSGQGDDPTTYSTYEVDAALSGLSLNEFISNLEYEKDSTHLHGIGDVSWFDGYSGEEDGSSHTWVVFTNGNQYWRITGSYSSWNGTEWYGGAEEVSPVKKVVTSIQTSFNVIR